MLETNAGWAIVALQLFELGDALSLVSKVSERLARYRSVRRGQTARRFSLGA